MGQTISARGLEFIAREEGCVLHPYNDSRGLATIGIGHLLHMSSVTSADRARWAGFTMKDALALLRKDAQVTIDAIHRDVSVPINQNEFDAVCSLIFNIGTGGFHSSTVRRLLNQRNYKGAAKAFEMWHIGGAGLLGRRKREEALFLTVDVDPLAVLSAVERKWVTELISLAESPNRARQKALVAALTKQRKLVWLRAQPKAKGGDGKGWNVWHRRERYRLLRQYTG